MNIDKKTLAAQIEEPVPNQPTADRNDQAVRDSSRTNTNAVIDAHEIVGTVVLISPAIIRASSDPNRNEASYASEEFVLFKEIIEASVGNTQPIGVRRLADPSDGFQFVLIWGHRRHRACLELGLEVSAVIEDCDDKEAYLQRLQENSGRVELSPFELGQQISDGQQRKHLGSIRHAARLIGRDPSDLAKAVQLAALDKAVIAAFQCTSHLQYRHAKPLSDAIKADRGAVVAEALRIAMLPERLGANEVVALLAKSAGGGVGRSDTAPPDRPLEADGYRVGRLRCSRTNQVEIEIELPLSEKDRESLARQVERLLGRMRLNAKPTAPVQVGVTK